MMRPILFTLALSLGLTAAPALAQQPQPAPPAAPPAASAPAKPAAPAAAPAAPAPTAPAKSAADDAAKKAREEALKKSQEEELALRGAVEKAGNDRAMLMRNLEEFLQHYPEARRKQQIYRAIVESAAQLRDYPRALDYAERLIAINPNDNSIMLFAVDLLERQGDDHSLVRAIGYTSRVLDSLEKSPPDARPKDVSAAEWEVDRKKLRMSLYLIRGRLEMEQHNSDAAQKDLETSFSLLPNGPAALRLGEIAEEHKDYSKALERYLDALVLQETAGLTVDRREVRTRLGNLWKQVHGSDAGLGDATLAAYDRMAQNQKNGAADEPNHSAKEAHAFVLRQLNGAPFPLAQFKGKVLVLDFWATWCGPCRELEPLLAQVAQKYAGHSEVAFLAVNDDEDQNIVPPYLARQKISEPVVFADGLDDFLDVRSFPTVIVLDGAGKIVYRSDGFERDTFIAGLTAAIERALHGAS